MNLIATPILTSEHYLGRSHERAPKTEYNLACLSSQFPFCHYNIEFTKQSKWRTYRKLCSRRRFMGHNAVKPYEVILNCTDHTNSSPWALLYFRCDNEFTKTSKLRTYLKLNSRRRFHEAWFDQSQPSNPKLHRSNKQQSKSNPWTLIFRE